MIKYFISSLLFLMVFKLNGQQLPQTSHYMYDQLRTNPGSAGSQDMICASLIGRMQWVGMPGAPTTQIIDVETPFTLFGAKHGIGVNIYGDQEGFNTNINFHINYAYRLMLGNGSLGIGVKAGLVDIGLKPEWLPTDAVSDPNLPNADPDGMSFTLGAGLFYRTEDIYFGASILNLNTPEVSTISQSGTGEATYKLNPHYYITAGYNMQLTNPAYEIIPSLLIKSDAIVTEMDLNLTVMYNKKIWGGVTYRTASAIVGMVGFELFEGLKVGYCYDFATTSLQNNKNSSGGHEVLINYCFKLNKDKTPQKYKSIRFL